MRITEQLQGYNWIFCWGQVWCHYTTVCLRNHNSKEGLGTKLKHSLIYNFLSVPASWVIFLMVLKWPCHNQNKNTCKELSQNGACNLDIGTQYWTDLHGIALKNNELNVVMVGIRHWGLVLICILYTVWQRGFSADIFAPVLDDNMSTQFLCAQSCTANIFMYTKVCALAKRNLFQPGPYFFFSWE